MKRPIALLMIVLVLTMPLYSINIIGAPLTQISQSPEKIDKQTTGAINHKVYVLYEIESSEVSSVNIDSCSGKHLNSSDLIETDELNEFWIEVKLNRENIDEDSILVNCTVSMTMDNGSSGVEDIEIEIPFYNLALGEYGDSVQDEINSVKDGLAYKAEIIDTAYQWLQLFDRICGLYYAIFQISEVLTDLSLTFKCLGIESLGRAVDTAAEQARSFGAKIFNQHVAKACAFIGCSSPVKPNLGDDSDESTIKNELKKSTEWAGDKDNLQPYLRGLGTKPLWDLGNQGSATKDFIGQMQACNVFGELSPSQSLPIAIIYGCIPGIIYKMKQWRQIECKYLSCLQNDVVNGVPLAQCQYAHSYDFCYFVAGEIFQFIPFADFISAMLQDIMTFIQEPFQWLGLSVGLILKRTGNGGEGDFDICKLVCRGTTEQQACAGKFSLCGLCLAQKYGRSMYSQANDLAAKLNIMDIFESDLKGDVCGEVDGGGKKQAKK